MTNENQQLEVTRQVSDTIAKLKNKGALRTPKNYDYNSAVRQAYFILSNLQTRDKKPVLEVCDRGSVYNALMEMVSRGLNPAKNQCYFIPYKENGNDKIRLQPSYDGKITEAKRQEGLVKFPANVVWKGEEFQLGVDEDCNYYVKKHEPDPEKWTGKIEDIRGVYCVLTFDDGSKFTDYMTMERIKRSWDQSKDKDQNTHKNFPEDMAIRTVKAHAVKPFIDTSDDSDLEDPQETQREAQTSQEQAPDYEEPAPEPEQKQEQQAIPEASETVQEVEVSKKEPAKAKKQPEPEQQEQSAAGAGTAPDPEEKQEPQEQGNDAPPF